MPQDHNFDIAKFECQLRSANDWERENAHANVHNYIQCGGFFQQLETLLSKSLLFEFVLSSADDVTISTFCVHMKRESPSLQLIVLKRLVHFLYFSPSVTNEGRSSSLTQDIQLIPVLEEALKYLSLLDFQEMADGESKTGGQPPKKNKSQAERKRTKRLQLDGEKSAPSAFQRLGFSKPSSKDEARTLLENLVIQQHAMLLSTLESLRTSAVATAVRRQYLSPAVLDGLSEEQVTHPETESRSLPSQPVDSQVAMNSSSMRPLRASLYFDSMQGLGLWRVVISTRAEKDLRGFRKVPVIFNAVVNKIRQLSHGHFSGDNQKRLNGHSKDVPIFEAKLTGDLRLVYQIDCLLDFGSDVERQVLCIYGIFTHAQMDERMWTSIGSQLTVKGKEYNRRVRFRAKPIVSGDNMFPPHSWPPLETYEARSSSPLDGFVRSNELPEIHQWLTLEKYMIFSQELFECILKDKDVSPIFAVSPREKEIIETTGSCYVLGRSGTGKTTTMLFKIFGIERAAAQCYDELRHKPRQLFVTQSRVLANRVQDYFANISEFLTKSSPSFTGSEPIKESAGEQFVDEDEEDDWRNDLPKRFSDLRDGHFPLFITYDKLCKLLEGEVGLSFKRRKYTQEHRRAGERPNMENNWAVEMPFGNISMDENDQYAISSTTPVTNSGEMLSFEDFQQNYWPHLPQNLTKRLDSALVFSEFIGVIKGSEQTLRDGVSYLSRDAYYALGNRKQATFAQQRAQIYDLFEIYSKLLLRSGNYDSADRTHKILERLKTSLTPQIQVDYLYVDEAQDNLIVDTLLLRSLCNNRDGLFWAGDTAQTIAIGSSFRFNELKALMYRVDENNTLEEQNAKLQKQPVLFQLTTNYRSHGGIINCADSIVQLIKEFWPESIDLLRREEAMVNGPKPIFIEGWNDESLRMEEFLFGHSGNHVEFGAQQCILVRNDAARDRLRDRVGSVGIILTLYESKGLEFDDVLLYNFFADSPATASQWRLVLRGAMPETLSEPAPQFDYIRHAGMQPELKFLYVAITRARKNLWIADGSTTALPLRNLFLSKQQIEVRTPETAPLLAVQSSTEQWAKAGSMYFNHKRYILAAQCFQRAGMTLEANIAQAYELRKKARSYPDVRIGAFQVAAQAFLQCARTTTVSRLSYYRIAGECFACAESYAAAADAFLQAEQYELSAQHYRQAGMFDEAIHLIQTKAEHISESVIVSITEVAKLFYFRENKIKKATGLFESHEAGLQFADEYGLHLQCAAILEAMDLKTQAVDVYLSQGQAEDAMRLLLSDRTDSIALQKAIECVLDSLADMFPLGTGNTPMDRDQTHCIGHRFLKDVLELAAQHKTSQEVLETLHIFQAIIERDVDLLGHFARQQSCRTTNAFSSVLATDCYLYKLFEGNCVQNFDHLISLLETGILYAKTMQNLCLNGNMTTSQDVQKLLGFKAISDFQFGITTRSLLHGMALERHLNPSAVTVHEMNKLVHSLVTSVDGRLIPIVLQCTKLLSDSKMFAHICLVYLMAGRCAQGESCERRHVAATEINASWMLANMRARILHIEFLQVIDIPGVLSLNMKRLQRECMLDLFRYIYPESRLLQGGIAVVSQEGLPRFSKAMRILHSWLEGRAFALNFGKRRDTFFDDMVQILELLMTLCPSASTERILRAPFYAYTGYLSQELLRGKEYYVVHELVQSLMGADKFFITKGIFAMRHIMDKQLTIKISTFCHVAEFLTGSIIILDALRRRGMHNTTMPRSWMLSLFKRLSLADASLEYMNMHVRMLKDIICHLLLNSTPGFLNGASGLVKAISIHRLFRCLGLLGYNNTAWDGKMRRDIVFFIRANRPRMIDMDNPIYRRYTQSTCWSDVVLAVRASCTGSYFDEMIHLVHTTGMSASNQGVKGVRRIVFNSTYDIPRVLGMGECRCALFSAPLSAGATTFVPMSSAVKSEASPLLLNVDETKDIQMDQDLEELIDDREHDAPAGYMDDEGLEMPAENYDGAVPASNVVLLVETDEENAAASIIQAAYRRSRRIRKARPGSVRHIQITGYFTEYLARATKMEWPPESRSRYLFLGLMPQLRFCVESILSNINRRKKNATKALMTKAHRELEVVGAQITHWRTRLQNAIKLRTIIDPMSGFHERCKPSELCRLLTNIRDAGKELHLVDIEDDLQFAEMVLARVSERRGIAFLHANLELEDSDEGEFADVI